MVEEADNPNKPFEDNQNDYEWLGTLSQVTGVNDSKPELNAQYIDVQINGKSSKALIDTGTSVSIVSEHLILSEINTESGNVILIIGEMKVFIERLKVLLRTKY